ncbi:chemotaxis protein CheA [Gemmatimonas groenlandica]|uniref:Chemotaxis protein CheA n=1 Tax=Gemmatimonas groenlandica TaxID=2732249 RepID=A0A6M4ISJ1_9BACT|nr:chemotaxis protein CheA [Gemmatimonas groenlandica]QJR36426.1 chemotaxis protein CheA [Gemmatimonas groenlandica]
MSSLNLDDAATLLMQLEATDTADLAMLREALTDLAFENRVPLRAQPFVARAARVLGTIVNGTAPDIPAAFADVSGAIDEAMRASEGSVSPADRIVARAAETAAAAVTASVPVFELDEPEAPHEQKRSLQHHVGVDQLPDDADRDLLPDFITESNECVVNSEAALLQLEEFPDDEEAVNTVFRAFHTVKGTSAFLGLSRIAAFAHEAESLLSRVRDKEIAYTKGCADLSLRSADMLKALLVSVETGLNGDGKLPIPDGYHELLDALAGYDPTRDADGVMLPVVQPLAPTAVRAVSETDDIFPVASTSAAPVASTPAASAAASGNGNKPRVESNADATIRVRTDRLDRLIDMVGELVIAQSMIAGDELFGAGKQHDLLRKVTHAGKIVRELQDLSMSMRMVPLRATFQKLTRVVRDTASKASKTVQFVTDGDDVEIDRNMVDVLGDPLVHMVRNAVDHGVEGPDERVANGKPRLGVVRLHAYHASGNVVVELKDDGRGLHRDKIVKKAIEKGLIDSDKGMTDSDVFNLIFAPGFSTAEQITDISGRGVGMDVVRRNLEKIRGRIDITSAPGKGTTFAIRLPLTLAVTDGMLVRVGDERFIVPLTHIHMSFRPEQSMLSTVVGRGEAVLLRGELLPIIRLHRLFDVHGAVQSPLDGLLMIVGDGDRRTALLVDDLLGQQQVVAKTLGDGLGKVPGVSGGAILGDGRVGLILDVTETVALAQSHEPSPVRRDRQAAA